MNVCFVALSLGSLAQVSSGVGNQVRLLAEALNSAGHSARVVTLGAADSVRHERNAEIFEVKAANLHWYVSRLPLLGRWLALPLRELEYAIAAWKGLRRAEKNQRIDIIEGTETGMLLISLFQKRPTIIRLHGEQYTFHKYSPELKITLAVRLTRLLQGVALRRASLLISPSQAHANEIAREIATDASLIRIIPNCVAIRSVAVVDGTNVNDQLVVFVGRLDRVKGVKVFLQTAALVARTNLKARFIVAGPSHPSLPQSEIDAAIRDASLQNSVTVVGPLASHELESLYRRASVVCVPSYYESFGLVALEAMAYGVPVVATRVGGLPEIVEDGATGVLVSPGKASEIAAAIVKLLDDVDARKQMGAGGRLRAEALFSSDKIDSANLSMYQEVLSPARKMQEMESSAVVVARGRAA